MDKGAATWPGQLHHATVLLTAATATTALAPTMAVAYVGLCGIGFAWSWLLMSVIGTLETAEPAMMGRVMSLLAVVLLGGNAAGGPIASIMVTLAGPHAPFVLGSVAAGSAAVITAQRQRQPMRIS